MLHLALLGIYTTLKEDLKCTAAELVYDTSLRLPGEFLNPHLFLIADPASYVTLLNRSDRTYKLNLNGRRDSVSIDRLKPAHIDFPNALGSRLSFILSTTTPFSLPTSSEAVLDVSGTQTVRSGRHVRWPAYLKDFAP